MNMLSELRKKAGLTQSELGRLVGSGQSTIANYESSSREPSITQARKIIKALNQKGVTCSIDDMYEHELKKAS